MHHLCRVTKWSEWLLLQRTILCLWRSSSVASSTGSWLMPQGMPNYPELQKPLTNAPGVCIHVADFVVQSLKWLAIAWPLVTYFWLRSGTLGIEAQVCSSWWRVSVPKCTGVAATTGIVSAYGLSTKYLITTSTKSTIKVEGLYWKFCWVVWKSWSPCLSSLYLWQGCGPIVFRLPHFCGNLWKIVYCCPLNSHSDIDNKMHQVWLVQDTGLRFGRLW